MQINISEIISTDYKVQTFNPEIEMEVFCLDGERYNFIRKSPVELKAQNEGHSVVNLSGHVDVTIDIPCSRCLTSVPTRLAFDFSQKVDFEKLKAEQLDDLDETSFMEESSLDVDRFVYNEILMRFPMKTLCREDCKGLCLKCGKNLNEGECGCDRASLDPRIILRRCKPCLFVQRINHQKLEETAVELTGRCLFLHYPNAANVVL